jgi:hypothetical protein
MSVDIIAAVEDTFLHFLADNLTGTVVHPIRLDVNDPASGTFQMNCINVQFLNVELGADISNQQVVLDVMFDNEKDCRDAIQKTWNLLKTEYLTPITDYSDLSNPTLVGMNMIWQPKRITFKKIISDAYCHYSCVIPLGFYANQNISL